MWTNHISFRGTKLATRALDVVPTFFLGKAPPSCKRSKLAGFFPETQIEYRIPTNVGPKILDVQF